MGCFMLLTVQIFLLFEIPEAYSAASSLTR